MGTTFTYQPLHGQLETRVLHLNPREHTEVLSGRLEHVSLDNFRDYEALSYEWGSPIRSREIALDGQRRLAITQSLYDALYDLRLDSQPRVIWADGVSINQDDLDEREQQVAIMGSVYARANRVITYTGPEKDGSTIALDTAESLFEKDAIRLRPIAFHASVTPEQSEAMRAFVLRGYSNRAWCAQEFLLNDHLVMMCGRREFPWSLIPQVVLHVQEGDLPDELQPTPLEDIDDHRLQCFKASDPRDKIYSVLGLLRDTSIVKRIRVDYNYPVKSLYVDVATCILEQEQDLGLLYRNHGSKSLSTLPSWVPDWSSWRVGSNGLAFNRPYAGCGDTTMKFQINAPGQLTVRCTLISRITYRSENIGKYFTKLGSPNQQAWLQSEMQHAQQLRPYPTREDTSEVLRRTLIGDIQGGSQRGRRALGPFFEAIFKHDAPEARSFVAQQAKDVIAAVRQRSRYRSICHLDNGYLGAVAQEAEIGDWVCMIHGLRLLFVVRRADCGGSEEELYRYVGHGYVHGLMDGQVLDLPGCTARDTTLI